MKKKYLSVLISIMLTAVATAGFAEADPITVQARGAQAAASFTASDNQATPSAMQANAVKAAAKVTTAKIQEKATEAAFNGLYKGVVYATENEGLALKTSANVNSTRICMIPEGTSLGIQYMQAGSDGKFWGYVDYNGTTGWVCLKYVKIVSSYKVESPSYGKITPTYYVIYNTEGEGLELRAGNGAEYSTFGPVMDGNRVLVTAIDGNWCYAEYNGNHGWLYMGYMYVSPDQTTPLETTAASEETDQADLGKTDSDQAGSEEEFPKLTIQQSVKSWSADEIEKMEDVLEKFINFGASEYDYTDADDQKEAIHYCIDNAKCMSSLYSVFTEDEASAVSTQIDEEHARLMAENYFNVEDDVFNEYKNELQQSTLTETKSGKMISETYQDGMFILAGIHDSHVSREHSITITDVSQNQEKVNVSFYDYSEVPDYGGGTVDPNPQAEYKTAVLQRKVNDGKVYYSIFTIE